MPAFGKSGTLRIFCLRWSMFGSSVVTLANSKPGIAPGWHVLVHLHGVHACAWRTVSDVPLESLERFSVAFGGDLDAPVRRVSDPPVQAFPQRRGFGKKPEPDALHVASDDVVPRDPHQDF